MRTPGMFINGIGTFLPETVTVDAAIAQGLCEAAEIETHEQLGAAVAGTVPAPDMALAAARQAFDRCDLRPTDADLLLYADTWHQGPDGWLPQSYLQRHLTGGAALAVEVGQGCNGMFGAMELAASYLSAVPEKRLALLVAADNYGTPLKDRWRIGPFILGDAASAVVLSKEPGFARLKSIRTIAVSGIEEAGRAGEPMFPPGPTIGRPVDFLARGRAFMRDPAARKSAAERFALVNQRMKQIVDQALAEAEVALADIARIAFISVAREIMKQRGLAALGVPLEMSTWDFGRTIGHCGASDQILAIDHLLRTRQVGPGDHLLLMSSAPGIVLSCAVVQILEHPSWLS
ncbi:ketoacyl-ACP synthase III family protein [Dactylosporangium sp. NPDC051541]|uniref:ketoacyl-ACP synthase III family protein n=1 Tax=Dactylosporangium sp. NPDC051541 TaxID=3363977 RepID=UPI0037B213D7